MAEWEREQSICQTHGGPREDCADAEHMWFPQRRVCYASMIKANADATYDDLHKAAPFHDGTFTTWGEKRTRQTPYHYRDGVTIWVAESDLSPHDHFLGGARECPDCRPDSEEVTDGNSP